MSVYQTYCTCGLDLCNILNSVPANLLEETYPVSLESWVPLCLLFWSLLKQYFSLHVLLILLCLSDSSAFYLPVTFLISCYLKHCLNTYLYLFWRINSHTWIHSLCYILLQHAAEIPVGFLCLEALSLSAWRRNILICF